ncbi:hypothetical protein [Bifidobacterium thermophilum]|uniref:hypothetical protein n=1 Tax=Bifidobacterium thermophilum TaxID=33905 RepID=UPI003F90FD4A
MDGLFAWMRISEVFPFKEPKQTAASIASWKLSSAVLHIGFSYELSNVAYLDTRLFNSGAKMALSMKDGECLLQSMLSHLMILISNIVK